MASRSGSRPSLLEHCPAGFAEARLLPPQAIGDGADIWDFAGTKPVDVRLQALRCSGVASAADAECDVDSASRKPTEAARLARLALAQARSNFARIAVLPC